MRGLSKEAIELEFVFGEIYATKESGFGCSKYERLLQLKIQPTLKLSKKPSLTSAPKKQMQEKD